MKSSNASRKLKVVIYKAIIRLLVFCGAETWTTQLGKEITQENLLGCKWERTMENKNKYGTIPIIQESRFGNGNKETETPLDKPRRENGRKQNTSQTHTQQSIRATKNRKTKKAVGRGCRRGSEEDGLQGSAKKSKGEIEWADVIKEAKVLQGL
jgi:hypothetical protein